MIIRYLLLAPALLLTAPAAAQQATAAQNLDCAVWAGYQVGISDNDDVKVGLSIAVAWFIGLYEGQTGQVIDDAMSKRAAELDEAAIDRLGDSCIARFSEFSDRLGALGTSMSEGGN